MNFEFLRIDGPLIALSVILALWIALGHVALDPRSDRLPRWLAYAAGVGSILVAFTVLTVVRHLPEPIPVHPYQPIADLAALVVAAAVGPTLGRVWLLWEEHRQHSRADDDSATVDRITGGSRGR